MDSGARNSHQIIWGDDPFEIFGVPNFAKPYARYEMIWVFNLHFGAPQLVALMRQGKCWLPSGKLT